MRKGSIIDTVTTYWFAILTALAVAGVVISVIQIAEHIKRGKVKAEAILDEIAIHDHQVYSNGIIRIFIVAKQPFKAKIIKATAYVNEECLSDLYYNGNPISLDNPLEVETGQEILLTGDCHTNLPKGKKYVLYVELTYIQEGVSHSRFLKPVKGTII